MFGYQPNKFYLSYDNWIEAIHPDDRAQVLLQKATAEVNGAATNLEYRVVWPDGSIHWLHDMGTTLHNADGQASYMLGIILNISDRKLAEDTLRQNEAKYRTLIESSDSVIALLDQTAKFVFINDVGAQYFGGQP